MPDDPTTDPNASSWAPGAPAPWLSPFGPSPDAGAVAPATVAPLADPSSAMPQPGPLDLSLPPGVVPPPNGVNLAAPQSMPGGGPPDLTLPPIGAPPSGPPGAQFTPPWLAAQAGPPPGAPGSLSLAPATDAAPSPPNSLGGVDAVSGGAAPAEALTPDQTQSRFGTIATDPNASLAERTKAWAAMTPDQKTEALNSTDPKQLAALANDAMSPQELKTIEIRHNAAKQDEETQKQLAIYKDNQAKADQEVADTKFAVAHADQESAKDAAAAQALVAQSKNIGKTGIGSLIGGGIAALVGGMFAHQMGGRNLGLEGFQKGIEQKIQAQTEELNAGWKAIDIHKNAVAQEFQRHGDLIRAQGVARLAAFQGAKDQLTAEMQNYDPKGTTFLSRAQQVQQINGLQATQAAAIHQQNFKNGMDLAKAQSEAAKQVEESRHNKASEGIDWAKVGIEKDKASTAKLANQIYTPDQFKAMGYVAPPTVPMTLGQYKSVQEGNKDTGEIAANAQKNADALTKGQVTAPTQVGTASDGTPITKSGVLTNKDGQTWHSPEKFDQMIAGANEVARLTDQLQREISEYGGQSDTKKSAAWQKMKSDREALTFAAHSAEGIEGFRPGTAEMLDKLSGDVDPTSFVRDASPGLKQMKDNITSRVNAIAQAHSYNGDPITFNDMSAPPPTKTTPADITVDTLTKNYGAADATSDPYLNADDRAFATAAQVGIMGLPPSMQAEYAEGNKLSPLALRAVHADIAPSQLKQFDAIEADVNGEDPKALQSAVVKLNAVIGSSKSAAVRAYAKTLLGEAAENSQPKGADTDLGEAPEVR